MEIGKTNKDLIFEEVAVSGILYITVDKDFICAQKFSEHIKIQIIFDNNNSSNNVKEQKAVDEQSEVPQNAEDEVIVLSDEEDVCGEEGSSLDMHSDVKIVNEKPSSCETVRLPSVRIHKCRKRHKQRTVKSMKCDSFPPSSSSKSNTNNTIITSRRKLGKDICPSKRPHTHSHSHLQRKSSVLKSLETKDCDQKHKKERKGYFKKLEKEKDVYCPYCEQHFKSQQQYFDHRKTERQKYSCDECQKTVQFKAHLMVHMRRHNEQKIEPGVGVSSQGMSSHYHSDFVPTKKRKVKCDVCGLTVSNWENLKNHTMIHTGEFAYKCCVCGQRMNSVSIYGKHLATHAKAGQVQCKICNIHFQNRSELSRHKFTHKYKCSLCGEVFPNKPSRYFHYKTFHKNDILKCPECGKLFSNKSDLDRHVKYHRNRNKTQCTVCGLFVFRLSHHMLSHTSKSDDVHMFVCDKCPKQFKHRVALQRHLRIHSEEKLYSCTECSKQFSVSSGLRRHMITHMPEKPYVCEVCGKSCSQLGNLKVHMQTHTHRESDVLHCPHCETSFTQKNVLQEHINSIHLLEGNIFKQSDIFYQPNPFNPIYH